MHNATRHGANAFLDRTVNNQSTDQRGCQPADIGELVGMAAEQGGYFGFDRLRQQRSRPRCAHLVN
jgi:hypothetical protein